MSTQEFSSYDSEPLPRAESTTTSGSCCTTIGSSRDTYTSTGDHYASDADLRDTEYHEAVRSHDNHAHECVDNHGTLKDKDRSHLDFEMKGSDKLVWHNKFIQIMDELKKVDVKNTLPYSERERIWRELGNLAKVPRLIFNYSLPFNTKILIAVEYFID